MIIYSRINVRSNGNLSSELKLNQLKSIRERSFDLRPGEPLTAELSSQPGEVPLKIFWHRVLSCQPLADSVLHKLLEWEGLR